MRYLLFTDVHGNNEALNSVLDFAKGQSIDHYLFLGDMVGYGASPGEVIDQIRLLDPISMIRGNHDKAVCELDPLESFNPIAKAAILWTRDKISSDNKAFLKKLKKGPRQAQKELTICHGAPFDEDFYIFGEFDAAEAFLHFEGPVCFFGHTHFPFIYTEKRNLVEGSYAAEGIEPVVLEKGVRYLINPGSVGQPRDRNSKAACAVYDTETKTVFFHRIPYDIAAAQKKILRNKLPEALAHRLSAGI